MKNKKTERRDSLGKLHARRSSLKPSPSLELKVEPNFNLANIKSLNEDSPSSKMLDKFSFGNEIDFHSKKIIELLQIDINRRKRSTILELEELLESVNFFFKLKKETDEQTIYECCKYLTYSYYQKSTVISSEFDDGEYFYIILRGTVKVSRMKKSNNEHSSQKNFEKFLLKQPVRASIKNLMKKLVENVTSTNPTSNENIQENESFDIYKDGDGFEIYGKNGKITEYITTQTNSHIILLKKKDLMTILRNYENRFLSEKFSFLQKLELFKGFEPDELNQIYRNIHPRFYIKDQTVYKQGDDPEDVFIIKSGEFLVTTKFDLGNSLKKMNHLKSPTNQTKVANVLILKETHIFGEEEVILGVKRMNSVICKSVEGGELFVIPKTEFLKNIYANKIGKSSVNERIATKLNFSLANSTKVKSVLEDHKKFIIPTKDEIIGEFKPIQFFQNLNEKYIKDEDTENGRDRKILDRLLFLDDKPEIKLDLAKFKTNDKQKNDNNDKITSSPPKVTPNDLNEKKIEFKSKKITSENFILLTDDSEDDKSKTNDSITKLQNSTTEKNMSKITKFADETNFNIIVRSKSNITLQPSHYIKANASCPPSPENKISLLSNTTHDITPLKLLKELQVPKKFEEKAKTTKSKNKKLFEFNSMNNSIDKSHPKVKLLYNLKGETMMTDKIEYLENRLKQFSPVLEKKFDRNSGDINLLNPLKVSFLELKKKNDDDIIQNSKLKNRMNSFGGFRKFQEMGLEDSVKFVFDVDDGLRPKYFNFRNSSLPHINEKINPKNETLYKNTSSSFPKTILMKVKHKLNIKIPEDIKKKLDCAV